MAYYGFKPNPKQLVINKAMSVFGREAKIKVTGARLTPIECKVSTLPDDSYHVECIVDGQVVGQSNSRNWRNAYKQLAEKIGALKSQNVQGPTL
jgi:hypothetical protein